MAEKIAYPARAVALPPPRSASCRETEDEQLGKLWGVSPKHAHTLKANAARRAADVIRLRLAKQDHEGAAHYARPFEDVMAALPCPDAQHREAVTDATEDVLQEALRQEPCEKHARALLRYRAVMRAASLDDDRRIADEWGITL